jgi:flagellar biosynthesis protein FliR
MRTRRESGVALSSKKGTPMSWQSFVSGFSLALPIIVTMILIAAVVAVTLYRI